MPVIKVRIEGDSEGRVQLNSGQKIPIAQYHALVTRQHGEENTPWDGDNAFNLHIVSPLPFSADDIKPENVVNGIDSTNLVITDETLQRMADDPDWFHVVCMVSRPGTILFIRKLELEHYRPSTPRNNLYNLVDIDWEDLKWIVISIPLNERHLADKVAKECGMAFSDGIPHMIERGKVKQFPMSSERVFSLRNSENSIVYNGIVAAEMTRDLEMKAIEELDRKHNEWLNSQVGI